MHINGSSGIGAARSALPHNRWHNSAYAYAAANQAAYRRKHHLPAALLRRTRWRGAAAASAAKSGMHVTRMAAIAAWRVVYDKHKRRNKQARIIACGILAA